ncbi:MAG: ectoine synthase [Acidimicrobiales bacterium]
MIVRTLDDIEGTDRDVGAPTFRSRRFLLAGDGTSFSFHDTVLLAGTTTSMWYRHHTEAVYCVEGEGVLTNRETDERHAVRPGTFYCLDRHERHELRADTDLRMMCVFTPPLTGGEVHDDDGVYPLMAAADTARPLTASEVSS